MRLEGLITFWHNKENWKENKPEICQQCEWFIHGDCEHLEYNEENEAFYCNGLTE